jgi:outer membrane protein assembly factor BamB
VKRGRARACGVLLAVCCAALVGVVAVDAPASARPVRTGRYVEIPYGIAEEHPWATEGGNARRNGRVGATVARTEPSQQWEQRFRLGRLSPPAVAADGTLYLAGAAGVGAVQRDGTIRWLQRLGYVTGTPSLTPTGDVAVGTSGGALLQITPRGDVRARTLTGGQVRGAPLVLADGSMVVGAFDQAVHRFDAEGRRLFRLAMSGQVQGAAAWSRNREVLVPVDQQLVVVTPRGDVRTRVPLGATIVAGPAVADDGTVWVLTEDGGLHQLSPRFAVRTRTDVGEGVTVTTTIAVGQDGAVRVPTRAAGLVCVGPNGTERWRLMAEGGFLGGVAIDENDVALAVNDQGDLLAIDPDGTVVWRAPVQSRVDVAPVVGADGTIYVATVRGTLQAWR